MIKCAVYGCPNDTSNSDPSVQFYFFPKHPVIAHQWLNACCLWRPDEIDVNTAQICSVHFDSNDYTSEYKMMDCLSVYTKVLKYDAIPTLYLPQQTVTVIKPSTDAQAPSEMKQILVYGVTNSHDQTFDTTYGTGHLIIENDILNTVKYEELTNVPTQNLPQTQTETKSDIEIPKDDEKYQIYKNVTSEKLDEMKLENRKLRKEKFSLEEAVESLKHKENEILDLYKKKDQEYEKLIKLRNTLERKFMSINDQKNLLSKVFSESQIKILSGKKKIYWSNDDMAVGYTIRHMSSKRCYMYLSKNLNIPLPALSSIKRWQTRKKCEYVKEEKE